MTPLTSLQSFFFSSPSAAALCYFIPRRPEETGCKTTPLFIFVLLPLLQDIHIHLCSHGACVCVCLHPCVPAICMRTYTCERCGKYQSARDA